MKITADFVSRAGTYINAVKEHELDLSGSHITAIENLGVTRDQYDALNLCGNAVRVLGNFPELARLRSIYIADNRVASIERGLGRYLPGLETLVLTNNDIAELVDLEPLRSLGRLRHLSLASNPVMYRPHARLWCVWRLAPSLQILNFERVTMAERAEAARLFGSEAAPTDLARAILEIEPAAAANTFVPGEGLAAEAAATTAATATAAQPELDAARQESIAELKARIREEMARVEAMEQFI
ncbi:U2 snRNP complex subunit [Coemansia javaensis]|uniref:U2 small nuclear ribonucleoprotein A' n=1 Tax=Coemansia javaensis TaxID=2761396 RepID=A0A9W8HAP6_9FUNG|nr:U2 snRNP complex subunit [Coemansia javaensis]